MPLVESLRYVVTADTAGAQSNLNRLGAAAQGSMSTLDRLKSTFASGFGIGAGVVGVDALVSGLQRFATVAVDQIGNAVNAAASLQQAVGSTTAVFGDYASEVRRAGQAASESVGLSNSAYQGQAAILGSLLQNLGKTRGESAALSQELIQLSADLGATFNTTTAQSVNALSAAFRGEFDTIERLGVRINQAGVNARVLALGLDTSTHAAQQAANAQAVLSLIYEQTANSQGQFAREADTLIGQQQRFTAELENARAELGEALLPAMTELVKVARDVIDEVDLLGIAFGNMASDVKVVADLLPGISTSLLGFGRTSQDAGSKVDSAFRNALSTVPGLGPTIVYLTEKMKEARTEAERNDAIGEAFRDLADGVREGTVSLEQFAPALAFLPPSLRAAAVEMLGLANASDTTAGSLRTLESVASELGSIGDSLFGAERAQAAFSKALDAGGGAANDARSQAKAYESALRRIEDAERGVADAQEALNETLIARFLVGLGASSDEVTSAQIQERESTRSLADAKLQLIDAEEALARLRGGGAAASRLEAQAAFLDAQKALAEAGRSGDPSQLLKARAALLKAQQGLDDTSSAKQAQDIAKAQTAVERASDGVTQAAIDQREAQRDLNDTLIRGKDGSLELRDANRQVEDAQRRLEDQTRNLDDAQDGLVDALNRTSAAGKTAAERFDSGVKSADSWIQFLVKNKATPDEFAAAIDAISQGLSSVATEAGKTSALDEYNRKLAETVRLFAELGGFGSKTVSGIMPKGSLDGQGLPVGGGTAARSMQTINLQVDGKTLAQVVVDQSNQQGGLPIRIKATN